MLKLSLPAACGLLLLSFAAMPALAAGDAPGKPNTIQSGSSYQNDTSLPLYYLPAREDAEPWNSVPGHEGPKNPRVPNRHVDSADPIVQNLSGSVRQMPAPLIHFPGIPFPGVGCNCAPPDTNGDVGETQYVQMVNEGVQVFDKATGTSLMGPIGISALWAGFGGVCENNGSGDPVVLYDQLADRWLISQFAGVSVPTNECIAISTTSDATGTYYRYAFNLGTNFFDYPHLGVWPDGYYMAMNVFNSAGTAFLGPQAFAFDRAAMLAGLPGAVFVTPGLGSASDETYLPADLDGDNLPPVGAPNPFLEYPSSNTYRIRHFHADFATPANSTFTLFANPPAAGFTTLCGTTRACVPQLGTADKLDAIGDRLMFRLAYRKFADHDALVGNFTVSSGGVAGIRWFELRDVILGPVSVQQQSTYQPDTTWRWMGSAAMDSEGNMALGYSASSASINPQLRYAGRLATDPPGTLPQAEAHLYDGTGSQTGTGNRWGDYSSLNIDPVDDCTFWYTSEYYDTTGTFNWRTRIGSFRYDECGTPGFRVKTVPASTAICAGNPASFTVNVTSVALFNNPVTLSASGNPASTSVTFATNPVPSLPGSSAAQVINTAGAAAGSYPILINGTASGAADDSATLNLDVFTAIPPPATLTTPANAASNQPLRPAFSWTGSNSASYTIEIATDAGFTNIVLTQSVTGTAFTPAVDLASNTRYYWRIRAANPCGVATASTTFSFITVALPGDCSIGSTPQSVYQYGFESGLNGWTLGSGGVGTNTWADNATAHTGTHSWKANDPAAISDQRFVSPAIVLPVGQDPVTLQFWNKQDMEARTGGCYDGGILEVSTNGGTSWVQIGAPDLLTDPYDGPISASFSNPLANLNAWCGPQDWLKSVVSLGTYAGSTVQFRFRLGSDSSVARDGWYLDDVKVQSCVPAPVTYTVTPAATTNGSIAPSTPQTVNAGNTIAFTLTPDPGYAIGTVSGCGGNLAGSTYTTGPVNADCTVTANFNPAVSTLAISIDDGRGFAAYGMPLSYTVTVTNNAGDTSGISLSSALPAQLDATTAAWICNGGPPGTVCAASGSGALNDSGITIPAGASVTWTVNASVLPGATGDSIAHSITVNGGGNPASATDTDALVLFRAGMETGDDGANGVGGDSH
jgi:hypothetical protein